MTVRGSCVSGSNQHSTHFTGVHTWVLHPYVFSHTNNNQRAVKVAAPSSGDLGEVVPPKMAGPSSLLPPFRDVSNQLDTGPSNEQPAKRQRTLGPLEELDDLVRPLPPQPMCMAHVAACMQCGRDALTTLAPCGIVPCACSSVGSCIPLFASPPTLYACSVMPQLQAAGCCGLVGVGDEADEQLQGSSQQPQQYLQTEDPRRLRRRLEEAAAGQAGRDALVAALQEVVATPGVLRRALLPMQVTRVL